MIGLLLSDEITQEDYLNYNNISILYKRLPQNSKGLIFKYKNLHIIVLNQFSGYLLQKKALLHEIVHNELDHCCSIKERFICECEVEDFLNSLNI